MKTKWKQYYIYKILTDAPKGEELEPWDGYYNTLREARQAFNQHYRNPGKTQDFIIVRETAEVLR